MKPDKIYDLNLHDSVIKEIVIHRAGDQIDTITFYLKYIENYKTAETTDKLLEFSECYTLHADMNFGCKSPDSILEATVIDQSDLVKKVENLFAKIGGQLRSLGLKHYRIETNTTGSIIDIVARDFNLINPD